MEFINTSAQEQEQHELFGTREGINIEKGIVLTDNYLSEHEELFKQYCNYFSAYPDMSN